MTFDFQQDLFLENERVKLTPLNESHIDSLLPFSLNEPELWKFSLLSAAGEINLKNYINNALALRVKKSGYAFIVYDKHKQQIAGSTRFYHMDFKHKSLSIGFTWYGKEFQRTGVNRHCKYLLLNFAFENLQMERVEFRADARNKQSIQAMKGIGCTFEGVLRNNCHAPQGRRDSSVLSIIAAEWNKVRDLLLKKLLKN